MELGLKGKRALITGGSHGIGLATAQALGAEGCKLAICSRSRKRLDAAVKVLELYDPNVLALECDVLNPAEIDLAVSKVKDKWETLHILVNNVGGGGRWGEENVENTPINVWYEVYEKNAMAAVRFTRQFLPMMRENKWGRVVTVTSIYGKEGGGRPWFNMAKFAETSLMKSLALTRYLVRDGITFNSVAPGGIYIEGTGFEEEKLRDPEKFSQLIDAEYPLGRMGEAKEVADVIAFVCSERAGLLNGASIVVDGGQTKSF